MEAENPVTIARYWWLADAVVADSVVRAEGIPSWVQDENLVRLDWALANAVHGMRLQVPAESAEEARAILADGRWIFEDDAMSDPCLACGSGDLEYIRRGRRLTFLLWLLLGVPLWSRRSIWRCAGCGEAQR